jgi:hypothetical protein
MDIAADARLPKSVILLREHSLEKFVADLIAGVTVGLVALGGSRESSRATASAGYSLARCCGRGLPITCVPIMKLLSDCASSRSAWNRKIHDSQPRSVVFCPL